MLEPNLHMILKGLLSCDRVVCEPGADTKFPGGSQSWYLPVITGCLAPRDPWS
jgi:hypothetical protein